MNARAKPIEVLAEAAQASEAGVPDLAHLARQGLMPLSDLLAYAEQLQALGHLQEACNLYALWLEGSTDPRRHLVFFNFGTLLQSLGHSERALVAYRACLALDASVAQARINMGLSLERLGRTEDALCAWSQVLELSGSEQALSLEMQTTALNHIGRVQEQLKNYAQAEQALQDSLRLNPKQPGVIQHWVHIRQKACKWPVYAPLPGIDVGEMVRATSPLAMLAMSDDPVRQLATAQAFVARTYSFKEEWLHEGRRYSHDKLRVGYVSADLREHAVGFLLPAFLQTHDRQRCELYAYDYTNEDPSFLRPQILGLFDHVRSIHHHSDREAAELVLEDEIDVLIDLHGLSSGARPGIFALHPAPRQGTYLGFIGSTGMPWFDFVLADRQVLPPELAVHFTEKPLYLDGCFLPLAAPVAEVPPVQREQLGLAEDAFVMAAFGNVYKITPQMFGAWMRLLQRIPKSVLWLIDDNTVTTANLRAEAARAGVDPARLVFSERIDHPRFCAQLRLADVYLDTYPYNCGSTSRDVIAAGVPMVTLYGPTMVSRMGLSLLHSLGCGGMAVSSLADYEDKVVEISLKKGFAHGSPYSQGSASASVASVLDQLGNRFTALVTEQVADSVVLLRPQAQTSHVKSLDAVSDAFDPRLEIFQICYSPETRKNLPSGFQPLDYMGNERADWREFWPIRKYLLTHELQDDVFYGFFSPRFNHKTGFEYAHIEAFTKRHGASYDVLAFSPFWDMNSFFLNPFLQGELFQPGLLNVAQQFCHTVGLDVDLRRQVMHSDNTIFCNYFVATRRFWLQWLEMGELMFAAAEDPESGLYDLLNQLTYYKGEPLTQKVFLQERLVSLVLLKSGLRAKSYDIYSLSPSVTPLNQFQEEAVQANALKHLHVSGGGDGPYLAQFERLQRRLFGAGLTAVGSD